MSQIINISIDLNKIDAKKIKVVTKKDGTVAKYLDVTIFTKDEVDNYGNNASMTMAQTKEERAAKEPTIYLGNGKVVFSAESIVKSAPQSNNVGTSDLGDSLPF
tara:strand:+ start:12180 stop:12491 length:312 start_codon:yes stop_codon:yes gene_type:complete